MRSQILSILIITVLLSIFTTSCKEDEEETLTPDNTEGLTMIAEGYATGSSTFIKLWGAKSPFAGYNKLFVQLLDSATNEQITNAEVSLIPMMDMTTMTHSAPYENPSSNTAVDGLFPCAVVFQMPGEMGWTLDVNVHNQVNDKVGMVQFSFPVKNPEPTRTHVITAMNDGAKLIISYVEPIEPSVGINDLEITIHKKESMMSFPADGSYDIQIEPEMPSMGHGSPNNENPVHMENGHYMGKVNFTMTGLWRINLTITKNGEIVDSDSYFEVTL